MAERCERTAKAIAAHFGTTAWYVGRHLGDWHVPIVLPHAKEDLLTMALGISQHRREEWCRPVDQRFLEALDRQKPDTLESFAAIWYRHNSEAGYAQIANAAVNTAQIALGAITAALIQNGAVGTAQIADADHEADVWYHLN